MSITDVKRLSIPRVVIAGTQSGVGKTTIVAGLLSAYRAKGYAVQAYKVGPDYIDPGFHKMASGRDCYNLDSWLMPNAHLRTFFTTSAQHSDIAIIEGVMGLYDGGKEGVSSTAEIAKMLKAPVVLVVDVKAMGESAVAIAKGFMEYDKEVDFKGVIINRVGSTNHENMIVHALQEAHIPVVGVVHRHETMATPERHLGLTPVTEINAEKIIASVQSVMETSIDLELLRQIAYDAPPLPMETLKLPSKERSIRIGVAYDEAFSFYYPSSLDVLTEKGAELVYFSPLYDQEIPPVHGLIFGGGFPEMFLQELSANEAMKKSIKHGARSGMPIYAECGGFMYLCEEIIDFSGKSYKTCGLIPAKTMMEKKLQKVGYVTAEALTDSVLASKGDTIKGHEFHFSTMEPLGDDRGKGHPFSWAFTLEGGRTKTTYKGGYSSADGNVVASYLHMHFAGNEKAAERFIASCEKYSHGQANTKQEEIYSSQGLIVVNTGDGKGKTTAALGMAIRAAGNGLKVLVLQFIKSGKGYGELRALNQIDNITVRSMGKGFIYHNKNSDAAELNAHKEAAQKAWQMVKEEIASGHWDMIILDEINYAMTYGLINVEEVLSLLDHKPSGLHMVLTGRNAPQALIDRAQTVTEMNVVKHAYKHGIKAAKGIEY